MAAGVLEILLLDALRKQLFHCEKYNCINKGDF